MGSEGWLRLKKRQPELPSDRGKWKRQAIPYPSRVMVEDARKRLPALTSPYQLAVSDDGIALQEPNGMRVPEPALRIGEDRVDLLRKRVADGLV